MRHATAKRRGRGVTASRRHAMRALRCGPGAATGAAVVGGGHRPLTIAVWRAGRGRPRPPPAVAGAGGAPARSRPGRSCARRARCRPSCPRSPARAAPRPASEAGARPTIDTRIAERSRTTTRHSTGAYGVSCRARAPCATDRAPVHSPPRRSRLRTGSPVHRARTLGGSAWLREYRALERTIVRAGARRLRIRRVERRILLEHGNMKRSGALWVLECAAIDLKERRRTLTTQSKARTIRGRSSRSVRG